MLITAKPINQSRKHCKCCCSSTRLCVESCYQFLHLYQQKSRTPAFSHLSHLSLPPGWVPSLESFCMAHSLSICFLAEVVFFFSTPELCYFLLFCFVLGVCVGGGATWIVCQSIRGFLLTRSCRFEQENGAHTSLSCRFLHLPLMWLPESSGR